MFTCPPIASAQDPATEDQRLRCLAALDVLDTPADPVLDGLVRCAAASLAYPTAMVSLVDAQRQWILAHQGQAPEETAREHAFCAHAIQGDGLFEVCDARDDPRFAANPLVQGAPRVRAYAGVPICVNGHRLGALCVIDQVPRQLTPPQAALLSDLARAVAAWFENRRDHLELLAERARSAERLGLLERLAEQAPGMLFQYQVGPDGAACFTYVSAQVQQLFALAPEAVANDLHAFLACTHPDDRPALRAVLATAAEQGLPWRHEFRVQLPGLATQWRVASAAPALQPDGTMLWHGFVADTTERVEIEQLRREKLAAERASAEKSAFLSRVSHELRTPLNAMLGFTQLLQIDEVERLTPRQRERVDHAHRAATLLLGLINDVLDLSQIEQGLHRLEPAAIDVTVVVTDCLDMVRQLALGAGVHLEFVGDAQPGAVTVHADHRALEQVLLNLLSNGIKYNRRGGALVLDVRTEGASVAIAVHDEGAGLDASQQSRLFQPFNRLGAETTRVEGSGLGLVIARQLAEAMGGRIAVDSTPGQGSTFTLWLPLHRGQPQAAPVETAKQPVPVPLPVDAEVTVLYIEDDAVNALLVQEALRSRPQWRLVHAADGHSGLALAQVLQPTVVLTDINLPGLSGQDVVLALRRDPRIRRTLCIALSADAMPEQVQAAMRAGFDDYWTKPLDVRSLAGRIETWLHRGDSRFATLPGEAT